MRVPAHRRLAARHDAPLPGGATPRRATPPPAATRSPASVRWPRDRRGVRRRRRRRVRRQPVGAEGGQPVAGGHAGHRRSGLPAARQPRSAGRRRRSTPVRCSTRSARTTSSCSTAPGSGDVRPGVQIVAAPWRSKTPTADLAAAVAGRACRRTGPPGSWWPTARVDVLDPDRRQPGADPAGRPVPRRSSARRVHYVALGDKHSRTEVGEGGRVWYSGSPEVTNYDHVEADSGHVLVVDVDLDDPAHPVTVESRTVGTLAVPDPAPRGQQQPRHRRPGPQPRPTAR